jgi:hypothetical protein
VIPPTGWWRFAAWVFAGGLTAFAWITGFSIGLFLLPLAVLAIWFVARKSRIWPEILGLVGGLGVVGLVIAAINHEGPGCRTTEEAGGITVTCGGLDPKPWLVGGLLLLAAAPALYALARRKGQGNGTQPAA